jgi:hypothetical protein
MKIVSILGLIFLALTQISCGSQSDPLLTVEIRYQNVILIDGGGKSCTKKNALNDPNPNEDDIAPIKALLGGVKIEWKGENDLEILYLRVRFIPNGNNEQVIIISGAELGYALKKNADRVVITANGPRVLDSQLSCNLEVGGINLGDKTKSQFGQGSVLVYGVTTQNGQQVAVQAQAFFSFQFDGIN